MLTKQQQAILLALCRGYSYDPQTGTIISPKGKCLKLRDNSRGYLCFSVREPNTQTRWFPVPVHKVAAYLKFGELAFAKGFDTRHRNGNSYDNREDNILLGTRSENMLDVAHARRIRAAKVAATARWGKKR